MLVGTINVMELGMNRTFSMPKSVLCYLLDKGLYFGLEVSLHPLFFPNKKRKVEHSADHRSHLKPWNVCSYSELSFKTNESLYNLGGLP